jgi:peptidoglycan hydrolase CwlO-like protein
MRSHPVKRVVSGAIAAASVITLVTMAQPQATAAPIPVLQAPPTGSDALAKYRDLAGQAEKLNEDLLKAQADLTAKQGQLDKANADVTAAKDAGVQAGEAKQKYQSEVDKFAGASFTSGVQMNKLSALLAGTSTQDFLDRSSALEVIATDGSPQATTHVNGARSLVTLTAKPCVDTPRERCTPIEAILRSSTHTPV